MRQMFQPAPKIPFRHLVAVLLLVLPLVAFAPPTKASGMVRISAGTDPDVILAGRLYRPARKAKAPAVILMHGCGGWQPPVLSALKEYARYLSANGIVVLNLDSFGPRRNTGGRVCRSFKRLAAARDYRTGDAFAALRYLQAQPFVDPENVFLIGQSNGGSVALIAAQAATKRQFAGNRTGFRGAVALYPWCGATGSPRLALAAPLLVLGGGRDDWVPPDDCTKFTSSGAGVDVKVYPDAAHSFDLRIPVQRYLGKLVGYDKSAALDARREILAFIRAHSTRAF